MCFPFFKTIVITFTFALLCVLIYVTAGARFFVTSANLIKEHLPTPHITLTFGRSGGFGLKAAYDVKKGFIKAGYTVEQGKLAALTLGTCEQCMGSPAFGNSHLAVLFEDKEGTVPECYYANTSDSFAFHLARDEALILISESPSGGTFSDFMWGVYLFDSWGGRGRNLIQAAIGDPVRPKKGSKMMMIVSFMPEIMEVLVESLQIPDIDERDIHQVQLPTKFIKTDLAPRYNDRLAILFKSRPNDLEKSRKFYEYLRAGTEIYKVRVGDPKTKALIRQGITFENYKHPRLGSIRGKEKTESQSLSGVVDHFVDAVRGVGTVIQFYKMLVLRSVLGVKSPEDCARDGLNCLAEDWDLAYTVSGSLFLPEFGEYAFVIVGVDHPEGKSTTIGLFDVNTNQQVLDLPISGKDLIYIHWLSRTCVKEMKPCTQINTTGEFFVRERSYGVDSYENLVPPRVMLIKYH